MQIAASNPQYIRREDMGPQEVKLEKGEGNIKDASNQ